jgi:hypothetical protein
VSTFEVDPTPAPTIVSVDRRLVTEGEDVAVRFAAAEGAGSVAFVVAGSDPEGARAEVAIAGGETSGTAAAPTGGWEPGAYEAVLRSGSGEELARARFWVQPPDGEPEITTGSDAYATGQPIDVVWRFSPGNRWDWVGVYRRGADPHRAPYLLWVHTGGTVAGSAVLDRDSPGAWPLRPGSYTVYLMRDDSYVALAGGDFTVR